MPVVAYYQGRPARAWTRALSCPARAAAHQAAATSAAGRRPEASAARQGTPEGAGISVAASASASAWVAWARNWFTPSSEPERAPV